MGVIIHFQIGIFFSFRKIPRGGIDQSYGHSMFYFLRNLHTVFQSVRTKYLLTNGAQCFPFLHILTNTCYLLSF